MYKCFYGHMFSFLGGKYLGVKWLDHMVGICLTFLETAKLVSKVDILFYIHIYSFSVSISSPTVGMVGF